MRQTRLHVEQGVGRAPASDEVVPRLCWQPAAFCCPLEGGRGGDGHFEGKGGRWGRRWTSEDNSAGPRIRAAALPDPLNFWRAQR